VTGPASPVHAACAADEPAVPDNARPLTSSKIGSIAMAGVLALTLLAGCTSGTATHSSASTAPPSSAPPATVPPSSVLKVEKSVVSDVVNASLTMESYYSVNNAYPTTKAQATAKSNTDQFAVTSGNHLVITTDGATGYCIAGSNPNSPYTAAHPKTYDSVKGGLQVDGAKCSTTYPKTFTLP